MMGAPLLDDLVDRVIASLLDERGAVTVRETLSAITFAYCELDQWQQIDVQTRLFSAAIVSRLESRIGSSRDLVNVTVEAEPGLARRAPERRLDA